MEAFRASFEEDPHKNRTLKVESCRFHATVKPMGYSPFNFSYLFAFKTAALRIRGSLTEVEFLGALKHYHQDKAS